MILSSSLPAIDFHSFLTSYPWNIQFQYLCLSFLYTVLVVQRCITYCQGGQHAPPQIYRWVNCFFFVSQSHSISISKPTTSPLPPTCWSKYTTTPLIMGRPHCVISYSFRDDTLRNRLWWSVGQMSSPKLKWLTNWRDRDNYYI